jgi:predicted nucleic acid-binding protein
MDIILDTNIFRNDFFFKSNDFEILKDYLKKTDSSFILPEIILEELKGLYRKTLDEKILNYKKACRDLSNVLNEEIREYEIKVENQVSAYIDFVLNKLKIEKRKIIPYKNDYLPELVKRAIASQKRLRMRQRISRYNNMAHTN